MRKLNEPSIKAQAIGLAYRFSKSVIFNIFVLFLGFILGYQFFANREYLKFVENEDAKTIDKIHNILEEHIKLNEEMKEQFSKLKISVQEK